MTIAPYGFQDNSASVPANSATMENFTQYVGGYADKILGQVQTISAAGSVSTAITLVDATSGPFNLTLPNCVGFVGRFVIRAINTNTNAITLLTTGGQLIDGASSTTVGPAASGATWLAVELISDGAGWRSI